MRALRHWTDFIESQQKHRELEESAAAHHNSVLCRKAVKALKAYNIHCKDKKIKMATAEEHRKRSLTSRCLQAWLKYAGKSKQAQLASEIKWRTHAVETLQWAFQQWRDGVQVICQIGTFNHI